MPILNFPTYSLKSTITNPYNNHKVNINIYIFQMDE